MESKPFPYQDTFSLYRRLSADGENVSLLLESRSLDLRYGKESAVVPNPILKISGKNNDFRIEALTLNGESILQRLDLSSGKHIQITKKEKRLVTGRLDPDEMGQNLTEEERISGHAISSFLRLIGKQIGVSHPYFGLYGAVAYDFARHYYAFGNRFSSDPGEDYIFFLPAEVYAFNDIEKTAMHHLFFPDNEPCHGFTFQKNPAKESLDIEDAQYLQRAGKIIKEIKNGRAMQCVFSRQASHPLQIHPLISYQKLREINPAPYSFYFSLGNNEVLYGASPELHIKIKDREIEIRPIAGTMKRSENPLEDSEARIKLLTDEKEKREHTMLVDLARSELCSLCEDGSVAVSDLFTLEHYPNLYHMVSGVKGKLRPDRDAFDALLITLPAGTLSGAPKLEAMKMIEENEASRRGFYGGIIGYFSFGGDCNTGITIRSIHVKNGMSMIRSGGGIVALSSPKGELSESKLKMAKMLEVVGAEQ